MSAFSHIALIGFGEVGQTLGADLLAAGVQVCAYDILFDRSDSAPSRTAQTIPVRRAVSAADAVRDAELVISAVTAAADLDAARSAAPALARGAFYLDLNSVSPAVKQAAAQIIEKAGGRYVEAAVMTPIASKRIASATLLGGPHASVYLDRARLLGFTGEIFSEIIGRASAAKMCRSVIIKGIEALVSESMLAARRYGVEKEVLHSLSDLLPVGDWEKLARYLISRGLEHGARRAQEMREAARTVEEAGIEPLMSMATAARQDWSAAHRDAFVHADDLARMLDAMREDADRETIAKTG